jgi:cytochrome d ubiquinol oxidase subunit II
MLDLNTIWFLLVGVLVIGYGILDGFDFGVGILHLFAKDNKERRVHLNAIGPVWDGNEVWLLTGGGALFAAFPAVYATIFSGFYLALILLLVALIFRAVSLEFRSKVEDPAWRSFWDYGFGIGSLLPAILFGVAFGNVLHGVPIDQNGNFTGTFFGLLNPFSVAVGLVSLSMFLLHGAIYLAMKSEAALHDRTAALVPKLWIAFVAIYSLTSVAAFFISPFLFEGLVGNPLFWIVFLLLIASVVYIPIAAKAQKFGRAFLASSALIASATGLAAISLYPRLVPSSTDLKFSLDIYNSASTPYTQTIMLIIAGIGVPIVLLYTIIIYRIFRGKVKISPESY